VVVSGLDEDLPDGRSRDYRIKVPLPARRFMQPEKKEEIMTTKTCKTAARSAVVFTLSWLATSQIAGAVNYDKLSTPLAGILDEAYRGPDLTVENIKESMDFLGQIQRGAGEGTDRFYVYINVNPGFPVEALPGSVEVVDHDEAWKLVAGWVPESELAVLTEDPAVDFIRSVHPPRYRMQGTIDTEGNAIHNADTARLTKGITGMPIKVGVVSDGVTNWTQVAGTNDLPPFIELPQGSGSGDEGTAMLEIIHDIAPGAQLAFCPSGSNVIAFVNAITSLRLLPNCRIVCDDVGWYSEPYFYHGYVAQQLQNLGAGTNYLHVTAAGNDAEVHHQQVFTDGNSDQKHDPLLQAALPPNGVLEVWLQWNDFVPNYGDYDIVLEDNSTGSALSAAVYTRSGSGGGYPGEYAFYWNQSANPITVDAVIQCVSGNAHRTMEVFFELWNGASITPASQPNFSGTDAIFGQAALPGVVTVGAVDHLNTAVIESFSSQGPVSHLNTPPIQKPDVVGVDNVSVSVGVTAPWSGFSTSFSGTSAAAPHIAGLLALAWSYSPGVSLSGLVSAMTNTAADLGAVGYDPVFGHGLPDADATAGALNLPPFLITPGATINATQKVGKEVAGLAVNDPDAGSNNLSLTLTANHGNIIVDENIPSGVTQPEVTSNGTNQVTVTAPLSRINTTLGSPGGLIYIGHAGFTGLQTIHLLLSDNGNSGFGGPLGTSGMLQLMLHHDTYDTWARDSFGADVDDAGKEPTVWGLDANPDGDLYVNQWEFFTGADPNAQDGTGIFVSGISGTNFTYTFPVSNRVDPNAYDVLYSADLATWTSVPFADWTLTPHPTLPDAAEVRITRPLGSTKEFLRIGFEPRYQAP